MTRDDLIRRLAAREDNFTERKSEGVKPHELRRTACAFANSLAEGRVGVLFVGVHDATGAIQGVTNSDSLQKNVRKALLDECYPAIAYSCEVLALDGKDILAVVIPASRAKPHFTGPAYVRMGSQSVKASAQMYEDLINSRHGKCQQIQRMMDQVITVVGLSYRVGSNKVLKDSAYRHTLECRIESCDAHVVRLKHLSSQEYLSEPLERVTIGWDDEKQRPMLTVSLSP